LIGGDPARLNFIARLSGSGEARPLLLIAHSDVVPADLSQWSADPFGGALRGGYIYGRGAVDDKNLLAAEMAVLLELRERRVPLQRDVILLAESDEESGSTGIQWLIGNNYAQIDAEAALNEGGTALDTLSGVRVFQIQTSEKIPTRVTLQARGAAGHGSLPRADNAVVHLARAVLRLAEADQPVRLNQTTRRYLSDMAKTPDYSWLGPELARLENSDTAVAAANRVNARDADLGALLRTTVSPTMLRAGTKINVIPNTAEAQVDVRRLPNETREEVLMRFRRFVNDGSVEVLGAAGQEMPETEPSSLTTPLYTLVERVLRQSRARSVAVPYMARGATDGAFLRAKGMAVYGVPVFVKEPGDHQAHGNDERISIANFNAGTELLWKIVLEYARDTPKTRP
jgi:acetylornithine deacetylase/succinyl-diaminopimelate desuccinylase-like protein